MPPETNELAPPFRAKGGLLLAQAGLGIRPWPRRLVAALLEFVPTGQSLELPFHVAYLAQVMPAERERERVTGQRSRT